MTDQTAGSPAAEGLLPATFFGPISWYRQLAERLEELPLEAILDRTEDYVKQTVRNHCVIATADGPQKLTVPVSLPHHPPPSTQHPTPCAPTITQVRISDHGNWRQKHWNALTTAYGQSPFFDYYADDLREFFTSRRWELLFDYDLAITRKVLELLGLNTATIPQVASRIKSRKATRHPSLPHPYWQVHQQRTGFLADLSILDLLCCMGPEAILHL